VSGGRKVRKKITWNEREQAFLDGTAPNLRIGGYGGTVKLWTRNGKLLMERSAVADLRRKQSTVGEDTLDMRRDLLAVAKRVREELATRSVRSSAGMAVDPEGRSSDELTIGRILSAHFAAACPRAPATAIYTWGRPDVVKHRARMTPQLRRAAHSVDQASKILQAARSLLSHKKFRADRPYDELQFTDLRDFYYDLLEKGRSPETPNTYLSVLRAAIRGFSIDHATEWGGRPDVTQNAWSRLPTKGISRSGYTESEFRDVTAAAHRLGEWRLAGELLLIGGTGRRVGDMGADRYGNYVDALPLCGNDLTEDPSGQLWVRFRADVGKADNYGRGDLVREVPESIAPYIRDLLSTHANPMGPHYPVFWDSDNPTQPVGHHQLSAAFERAWAEAYPGRDRPRHKVFHAMSKATITEVSVALGTEMAADWSGKTRDIVDKHYRDQRPEDVARATRHVSEKLASLLPPDLLGGSSTTP